MRIAVDTNAYVAFCRGQEPEVAHIRAAGKVLLPFICIGELRAGFAHGSRTEANERVLTRFLNNPRVEILYADDQTTHHYARFYAYLRKNGTPIPTNDIWIAALAFQHEALLLTRDTDFANLPQIAKMS